jgi:hypothetical protein
MIKKIVLIFVFSCSFLMAEKSDIKKYDKGYCYEENGWTYVHIEGKAFERGKQYGYLTAKLYEKALETYKFITYFNMGVDYSYLVKQAVKLHKDKIPEELLEEMRGYAAGLTEAGVDSSLDDIIGWNAYDELTGYWWGDYGKKEYLSSLPANADKVVSCDNTSNLRKEKCSAFIATGKATHDGKIVAGHTTFDDFWNAPYEYVMLDIKPEKGEQILMQTQPGYLISMTDFFITGAGIIGMETTIEGMSTYDVNGIPEYVRVRMAMQYGKDIDGFIKIMQKGNNGGNASSWLLGDINTNEIALFEQGYLFTSTSKKNEGHFFGCNVPFDPKIRNLECSGVGYNDVRRQTGGRRARWPQLLEKYDGEIDLDIGKKMLADTYDVYLKKNKAGANTICSYYDEDPRYHFSSQTAVWVDPYTPAGSVDGKVTTADMAKDMTMAAICGRATGKAFDADKFLKKHPQWNWEKDYLKSRPSQPYTLFKASSAE